MNAIKTVTRNFRWLGQKLVSPLYKREQDLWVFGEWMGNRCCDNSLYFANYLAKNHPELRLVWIAKETADTSALDRAVRRVTMDTQEATEVLKRAAVAVMNQSRMDFSSDGDMLYDGALTVQLWHGVPWKKIGLDMQTAGGGLHRLYSRYLSWLQRADLHMALSDGFSTILQQSFLAKKEDIILAGYPRNMIFYDPQAVFKARALVEEQLGVSGKGTKIITYMPTFRDNTQEVFSFEQLASDPRLAEILEQNNAVIVQKAHFISYERDNSANSTTGNRLVTMNDIPASQLLAASDVLITDYSSCFFDYLLLDRPIIHYIYDYAYYANTDRGVYYKAEDVVCGDAPQNPEALLESLRLNLEEPKKDKALRQQRRLQYIPYESENACEQIWEQIQRRLK